MAAGSWSAFRSEKLGIHLLLQVGKGYRINTAKPTGIKFPAILVESKVAVTPMKGFTRIEGTMEIAGIHDKINKTRVSTIAYSVTPYYPQISLAESEKDDAASGLRPVSPDSLTYIVKSSKCSNLTIATGDAMIGLEYGYGYWKIGVRTDFKKET